MKLQRIHSLLLVPSLVLFCSAAWTQTFYTSIRGTVNTCTHKEYSETAQGDIKNQTSDSCADGDASASSSASLDTQQVADASAQNGAGGGALAEALQTATLIPPKGFTGKTVLFSVKSAWAINITGIGPGTGMAKVCVGFPLLGNRVCQISDSNGSIKGVIHGTYKLTKTSSGFQLSVMNLAYAEAAGNAPPPPTEPVVSAGAVIQSNPTLVLPKGWKCKYDSGTSCP